MEDTFVEFPIRLKRSTYDKLDSIVRYFNNREVIVNSERQHEVITIEQMMRGAIVREIEKIETYNHLITYDGKKTLGERGFVVKNRIKQILKERNMRQLDLCELTGIDRSSMSGIVNNNNQPSADYLLRIWVALDFLPIDQIFYREKS